MTANPADSKNPMTRSATPQAIMTWRSGRVWAM